MEFLRVYLKNDGNIKRGCISDKTTGKLIPDGAREVWFNCETGMLCQTDRQGDKLPVTTFYHCSKIQGDITFSIHCFSDHFEKKTYDDLVGFPKKVTKKRR